jgi:hypothetical protein
MSAEYFAGFGGQRFVASAWLSCRSFGAFFTYRDQYSFLLRPALRGRSFLFARVTRICDPALSTTDLPTLRVRYPDFPVSLRKRLPLRPHSTTNRKQPLAGGALCDEPWLSSSSDVAKRGSARLLGDLLKMPSFVKVLAVCLDFYLFHQSHSE